MAKKAIDKPTEPAPEAVSEDQDQIKPGIHAALLAAQKEIPEIPFEATLGEILKAVRPVLNTHGLVLNHIGEIIDGVSVMSTVLFNLRSCDEIRCSLPTTQFECTRRMGTLSILGITTEGEVVQATPAEVTPNLPTTHVPAPAAQPQTPGILDEPPATPPQDRARNLALDLQSLDIEQAIAVISVAETPMQLEIAIGGLVGGEAWLNLSDRGMIIEAARAQFPKVRANGQVSQEFIAKMKEYSAQLTTDIQADHAFDDTGGGTA